MCGPAALLPLVAVSTAVSAGGHLLSAAQNAATANYQAKIADQNSALTRNQQQMAADNSRIDAQRLYRQIGQREGQQRAAQAANGVDLGFGSALQTQQDTADTGVQDASQVYRQASQTSLGYDIGVANDQAKASGFRQEASGAWAKGLFDTASTVLGGATQYSSIKAKLSGK